MSGSLVSRLARRRTIWFPTGLGWVVIIALLGAPALLWIFGGESFLSLNAPKNADVLVLEAWTGTKGATAAAEEFRRGGYRWIVAAGGPTTIRSDESRWSYADMAERSLISLGIPSARIITAAAADSDWQRTFETAAAARRALRAKGVQPTAINVFTLGAHARRSHLVFAEVFEPHVPVGIIAWIPPGYKSENWWRSSERAADLIKETAGFLFELLPHSTRVSTETARDPGPGQVVTPGSARSP